MAKAKKPPAPPIPEYLVWCPEVEDVQPTRTMRWATCPENAAKVHASRLLADGRFKVGDTRKLAVYVQAPQSQVVYRVTVAIELHPEFHAESCEVHR